MSSISQLLSQHGMLTSLCGNLSSADIIHLAATSKEHWTYIKESTEIYRQLQSTAICDGRGIVAREKLFFGRKVADEGKWDQDDCLGVDAKPCSDCGAIVCNVKCPQELLSRMSANQTPRIADSTSCIDATNLRGATSTMKSTITWKESSPKTSLKMRCF